MILRLVISLLLLPFTLLFFWLAAGREQIIIALSDFWVGMFYLFCLVIVPPLGVLVIFWFAMRKYIYWVDMGEL